MNQDKENDEASSQSYSSLSTRIEHPKHSCSDNNDENNDSNPKRNGNIGKSSKNRKRPLQTNATNTNDNTRQKKKLVAICNQKEILLHVIVQESPQLEPSSISIKETPNATTRRKKTLVALWNKKEVNVRVVLQETSQPLPSTSINDDIQMETETIQATPTVNPATETRLVSSPSLRPPVETLFISPTDQPTATNNPRSSESMLKSLLSNTRRDLKADGTPEEPKERQVYDDEDDNEDMNTKMLPGSNSEGDAHLPNVSKSQPSSPTMASTCTDHENRRAPLPTTIQIQDLNDRMNLLFPYLHQEKEGKVSEFLELFINLHPNMIFPHVRVTIIITFLFFHQHCIAARLFACFSLEMDAQRRSTGPSPRKRPRLSLHETSIHTDCEVSHDPIIKFLDSLVQLELAVLQGEQELRMAHRNRRVAFCAYDGSALQPPSDVIEDSHAHKQAELSGLTTVMERLHQLQLERQDATTTTDLLLQMVVYLRDVFPASGHAGICAQSLSYRVSDFPVRRVFKAAEQYASNLQQLTLPQWWNTSLTWERRLADASAQMVRYWLRTELNPVPNRAPCQQYSKQWNLRVCDLVVLQPPQDGLGMGAAIDDGSLSSIVSNAASHIDYTFGCDWNQWKSKIDQIPDDFFGDSTLARKGIAPSTSGRRTSGLILRQYSIDDWNQVGVQVEDATSFLAAANGAQFLYDLLAIIVQHSEHEQSWTDTIQQSASRLSVVPTQSLQEQDRHLTLLSHSPRTLLEQLPLLIHHSKRKAAQDFLEQLEENCLMGQTDSTSKRRKRAYQPDLDNLEASWEWCSSHIHFPLVTEYEDRDEEDDNEDEDGEK